MSVKRESVEFEPFSDHDQEVEFEAQENVTGVSEVKEPCGSIEFEIRGSVPETVIVLETEYPVVSCSSSVYSPGDAE